MLERTVIGMSGRLTMWSAPGYSKQFGALDQIEMLVTRRRYRRDASARYCSVIVDGADPSSIWKASWYPCCRDYDPATGRFTTPDPVPAAGAAFINTYHYG